MRRGQWRSALESHAICQKRSRHHKQRWVACVLTAGGEVGPAVREPIGKPCTQPQFESAQQRVYKYWYRCDSQSSVQSMPAPRIRANSNPADHTIDPCVSKQRECSGGAANGVAHSHSSYTQSLRLSMPPEDFLGRTFALPSSVPTTDALRQQAARRKADEKPLMCTAVAGAYVEVRVEVEVLRRRGIARTRHQLLVRRNHTGNVSHAVPVRETHRPVEPATQSQRAGRGRATLPSASVGASCRQNGVPGCGSEQVWGEVVCGHVAHPTFAHDRGGDDWWRGAVITPQSVRKRSRKDRQRRIACVLTAARTSRARRGRRMDR